MPHVRRLALLAFVILLVGLTLSTAQAVDEERPCFLFILVDDLGPEWISCYGADDIRTPRIDRLAETGMRFEHAYAMPKCTPTRVTLLTGEYPFRHGWVNHWDVPRWGGGCHFDPEANTTFARRLRSEGYVSAIAGKWQINDFRLQPEVLREHGFDEYCVWTGFETGVPASAERYWNPYLHTRDGSKTWTGRFGTDVFVDFLIDAMERHRDEPLCLYFPMALTHGPLVTTPDEPDVESPEMKHKAMVRYVDRSVGRLVDALDRLKLRERTYVFFTTDNGTSRGIRGHLRGREVRGGKGALLETGARVPFIVNAPGRVPSGVVSEALVDLSDIAPTFLELAGGRRAAPGTFDGRSFASVLAGTSKLGDRDWILAMGGGQARLVDGRVIPAVEWADRAVRDRRYKLVASKRRATGLFDLELDPAEEKNLVASERPEHVEARSRLEAVVLAQPGRDARPRYTPLDP